MATILASLHEEHKARQLRIKQAALKAVTTEPAKPQVLKSIIEKPIIEAAVFPPTPSPRCLITAFDIVLHAVCDYYNVRVMDVLSQRRLNNIVLPRHMVSYMIYRMTSLTTKQVAPKLNRDSTTVGYGIHKIDDNKEVYREDIEALEQIISARLSQRKTAFGT